MQKLFVDIDFLFSRLYVSVGVRLCAVHTNAGACRGQKRAPDPFELELQTVVTLVLGTKLEDFCKISLHF